MSESKVQYAAAAPISLGTLLGVLFVGLKLCHVIDWNWWWVTLPFWAGPAIVVAILIVGGLCLGIGFLWACRPRRNKNATRK